MKKYLSKIGLGILVVLIMVSITLSGISISVQSSKSDLPKIKFTVGEVINAAGVTPDYIGVTDVQVQNALNALPVTGGEVDLVSPTYTFATTVSRAINNVLIKGINGTTINHNGSAALFSVGSQTGWKFEDLKTDAGSITSYNTAQLINVTLGATYYAFRPADGSSFIGNITGNVTGSLSGGTVSAPTGRSGATLVVAASNSSAAGKAQADYVCTGTADNTTIQTAHNALPNYGILVLLEGDYFITSTINWTKTASRLECYGQMTANGCDLINIGTDTTYCYGASFYFNRLSGTSKGNNGIVVRYPASPINIQAEYMGYFDKAVYFPQNGHDKNAVHLKCPLIEYSNYGVKFDPAGGGKDDTMEGFILEGGVYSCGSGIYIEGKSGYGTVIGDFNNTTWDFVDRNTTGGWVLLTVYAEPTKCQFSPRDLVTGMNGSCLPILQIPKMLTTGYSRTQCDMTHWTTAVTGTGAVTKGIDIGIVSTGSTTSSTAYLYKQMYMFGGSGGVYYDKEITMEAEILAPASVANGLWYLKLDGTPAASSVANKGFGWKLANLDLYGEVHNGTTLTTTAKIATLGAGSNHVLWTRLIHGVGIQWFVDGVLAVEDMTPAHLPSSALWGNVYYGQYATNGATAADYAIQALMDLTW